MPISAFRFPNFTFYKMHLILEPGRAEKNYRRDLWRYRELLIILAWRDVKSRAIDVAVLTESETLQHEGGFVRRQGL